MTSIKKRNSNIELLRIVAMFMIVLSHYSVHSGIDIGNLPIGINRLFMEIISIGNAGVIIFVLITGYYGIEKERVFRIDKLLTLVLQVLFYSIVIYLVTVFSKYNRFDILSLVKSLLPISFKQYWFITAYISLYILMPFINNYLNSIDKKQFSLLLMVLIGYFIVLRTITTCDYFGNELLYFVIFYCIGAFINRYKNNFFIKNSSKLIIISLIVLITSVVVFDIIGIKYLIFNKKNLYFYDKSNAITLMFSIGIFCKAISIKSFNNLVVNTISKSVFGVYLIHNNPFVIQALWQSFFSASKYVYSYKLIPHCFFSVLIVFICCAMIDLTRYFVFEKNIKSIISRISKKLENIFKNYAGKALNQ